MYHTTIRKLLFTILIVFFFTNILCGCDDSSSGGDDKGASSGETTEITWYKDSDGDGFGDSGASLVQSSQPLNYVDNADDCDDFDAEIYPGASELCDGRDNDCDGEIDEGACDLKQIAITGEIQNLTAAEAYISEDSYFQLVVMPESGILDFETDDQGRIVYPSDLETAEIQSSDSFQFDILNLLPGKYVIAAQSLEYYGSGSAVSPLLSRSNGEFAEVNIPEDYAAPMSIELGEVFIPIPEKVAQEENSDSQNAQVPPMPPGISASDGAYTDKVLVTWNATDGATSYEVYRSESYMGTKAKLTTTSETSYADNSVPCGDSYYYWVKAKNAYGSSNFFYSDLGYRKCPAPSAPSNLSASDGDYEDMVRLSWSEVSEATGYDIYRATSADGPKTLIDSVGSVNYEDMNLVCEVTYYYWVKATNPTGESDFSSFDTGNQACSDSSVSGGDTPTSIGSIPAPTGVTASDGTYVDKIRIKWNDVSRSTSYDVYRSKDICGFKVKIGSTSANVYDDMSVPNRNIYYYWVKSKDSTAESEFSDYDTGHLMDIPEPPRGVSASDGKYLDKILVTWKGVGIAKWYDVYRADWAGATKTKIGTTSGTQLYDNSVECSTCCPDTYAYFVKARNEAGVSAFSDYDTGYVYRTLRDPDGVSASDDKNCCVYVRWEPVAGAKHYRIYRASTLSGTKSLIGTVDASCGCYVYRDSTATCP